MSNNILHFLETLQCFHDEIWFFLNIISSISFSKSHWSHFLELEWENKCACNTKVKNPLTKKKKSINLFLPFLTLEVYKDRSSGSKETKPLSIIKRLVARWKSRLVEREKFRIEGINKPCVRDSRAAELPVKNNKRGLPTPPGGGGWCGSSLRVKRERETPMGYDVNDATATASCEFGYTLFSFTAFWIWDSGELLRLFLKGELNYFW